METLILVDDNDNEIGTATREECHRGSGRRHRAFAIFLFDNENKILLQFRSKNKLGGSRWDVSATSHVRNGETYETAAERSMKFELTISVPVEKLDGFTYTEPYDGFSENEYCAVLVGKYNGKIKPNKNEIDKIKYMTFDEIQRDVAKNPKLYTKWFVKSLPIISRHIDSLG